MIVEIISLIIILVLEVYFVAWLKPIKVKKQYNSRKQ
jgi:hypothetical protein